VIIDVRQPLPGWLTRFWRRRRAKDWGTSPLDEQLSELPLGFPQHADEHRSQRPILLAVD